MEFQELYDLRRRRLVDFDNPKVLLSFLERIRALDSFPIVIGHKDFSDSEWRAVYLKPKTTNDELTVRNYLEGLWDLEAEFSKRPVIGPAINPHFRGGILYIGAEDNTQGSQNQVFLGVEVSLLNPLGSEFTRRYSLELKNDANTYTAVAKLHRPSLDRIMEPHMGPNAIVWE